MLSDTSKYINIRIPQNDMLPRDGIIQHDYYVNFSVLSSLLRLSLSPGEAFPQIPSNLDWDAIYNMALEQGVVGYALVGIKRLPKQLQPPAKAYYDFVAATAVLQQHNAELQGQLEKLCRVLHKEQLSFCVLKGWGIARLYDTFGMHDNPEERMSCKRQYGDIDIWINGGRQYVLNWINQVAPTNKVSYLHAHLGVFPHTEVELHFLPAELFSPIHNRRLRRWYSSVSHGQFNNQVCLNEKSGLYVNIPTKDFNLVYLMVHAFTHYLSEGMGLRLIMDYYCLLLNCRDSSEMRSDAYRVLQDIGLGKFTAAVMWAIQEVFHLGTEYLLCPPNSKEGRILLQEVLKGGNFGQFSDDYHSNPEDSAFYRWWQGGVRNLRFLRSYPVMVLCIPFWRLWHYCWRHWNGYE